MVYLTKLKHTGSVISSSDKFGAKMFEVAARYFSQYVRGIFIGTGSGVVAQYFMQTPVPFSFVEKHPSFVRQFHERFGAGIPVVGKGLFYPADRSKRGRAGELHYGVVYAGDGDVLFREAGGTIPRFTQQRFDDCADELHAVY